MEFSYLEAQVKDVFPQASPKLILRQAKRIVRQLNNITDGQFDTKTAIKENVNGTYGLDITASTSTIVDSEDAGGTIGDTDNVTVGDKIILSGTDSNDGVYTIAEITDTNTLVVTEDMVADETSTSGVTVVICTVDSTFSLSYNTPGANIMLTLPDSFNKLSPGGVIVANEEWDQRTIDYILRNTSEEAYNINERDEIVFAASAFLSDVDVLIRGFYDFTVPTSSAVDAEIAIPDAWIEGFMAGVLANLAILPPFKDGDIYKVQSGVFSNMVQQILKQEADRFTMESSSQRYNYNNPSQ